MSFDDFKKHTYFMLTIILHVIIILVLFYGLFLLSIMIYFTYIK